MSGQAEVVVVSVELRSMATTSNILVHGLQLQIALLEKVVEPYGRHIEQTVFACTVAVEQVVSQCCL